MSGRREPMPGVRALVPGKEPEPVQRVPGAVVRASGFGRHDEKLSLYMSTEERDALDSLLIRLRAPLREHGVRLDRGLLIRACIEVALSQEDAVVDMLKMRR